jgi:cytidine deaminase
VCLNGSGAVLMPCGRCRQLLWEHGGPNCLVQTQSGIQPMSDVLPSAFDAGDLAGRNDEGE